MRLAERYWEHVDRFSTELFLFIFLVLFYLFKVNLPFPSLKMGKIVGEKNPELVSNDLSLRTKYHMIRP